jgi:hypothetical protein
LRTRSTTSAGPPLSAPTDRGHRRGVGPLGWRRRGEGGRSSPGRSIGKTRWGTMTDGPCSPGPRPATAPRHERGTPDAEERLPEFASSSARPPSMPELCEVGMDTVGRK